MPSRDEDDVGRRVRIYLRRRSSCLACSGNNLDNPHHSFVLVIDGMAVIDEAADDDGSVNGMTTFINPGP